MPLLPNRSSRVLRLFRFTLSALVAMTASAHALSQGELDADVARFERAVAYVRTVQDEELAAFAAEIETAAEFVASLPPSPPVRSSQGVPGGGGGSVDDCGQGGGGNSPLPGYITQRESGDSYCAVNRSSGAFGRYQFMPSTWSSSCSDLPRTPDGQDECANRISNGGSNLAPWAATR